MIRLLRHLGRFSAGTVIDCFDAATEAAFILDGTAEAFAEAKCSNEQAREPEKAVESADEAPDYRRMKKDDLLKLAMARGLEVSQRAKVGEIIEALELSDDA